MWHCVPLTLFWFTYMGSLGIFFPYFSLYLRENAGLSGTQLGIVLAVPPLIGMFAQPFWGQIADRTGARTRVLVLLTFATAAGYLLLGYARDFLSIVLATAVLSLPGTALFPMMISISMAILREVGYQVFGHVRVWGTIGFFLLVVGFPWILSLYRRAYDVEAASPAISEPGLEIMFPVIAAIVLTAALIAWFLPGKGVVTVRAGRGDWRELLHNRAFLRFLLFALLAHFLLHGPMWFFPLFVRSRGGDLETIRSMWILMLLVEIPLVWFMGSGLKWLGARGLLMAGVAVGGLRWLFCALISDFYLLFAVQALHGITVVGLNLGSPLYLDRVAPEKLRSTAQGVLSMISMGVAGITSNLAAGWLVDRGGTDALYFICGVGLLALGVLGGWILPSSGDGQESAAQRGLSREP